MIFWGMMNLRHSIFLMAAGIVLAVPTMRAEQVAPVIDPSPAPTPAPAPAPAPGPAPAPVLDLGDSSSQTLTNKAWDAFNAKNYVNAKAYAQKCIELYKDQAVAMQKALAAPATEQEEVLKSWALNDVGACYFILGQSLEAEGKGKEAIAPLKFLVDNLSYAQVWDTNGWFWTPADAARERVKALEFEALQ